MTHAERVNTCLASIARTSSRADKLASLRGLVIMLQAKPAVGVLKMKLPCRFCGRLFANEDMLTGYDENDLEFGICSKECEDFYRGCL